MPTIALPPRKEKTNNRDENTEMRKLRHQAYASTKWRKMRLWYLQQHPICEQCLIKNKITAGTPDEPLQVHHIKSPFKGGKINWELLLDDNNLRTLCAECHGEEHAKENAKSCEQIIDEIDKLLNESK